MLWAGRVDPIAAARIPGVARRSPAEIALGPAMEYVAGLPSAERMSDIAHPTGFGAWLSAPVVIVAMMVTAIVSGSLTFLGRIVAVAIEALWLGFRTLGRLGVLPRRLRAALGRIFTLTPEAVGLHARPGDAAFHAHPTKPVPAAPSMPIEEALAVIEPALAALPVKGDPTLPKDLATLAILLAETPPNNDFKAADMVRDCFAPLGGAARNSRALLAVALRLSREFGSPTRLPLATGRAWHMLDPELFEDEMAAQLATISAFISDWYKSQQTFLCLEFGEIELIEFLFESLSPIRHSDLLCRVMDFKALSNRRQGILRRVPHRLRKLVQDAGGRGPAVLATVEATQTLLDHIAATHGYGPIIEAATASLEEVKKIAEKLRPPPAAVNPTGAGQPLAKITPVKRSAAELAEQATATAARAASAVSSSPPPPSRPQQQIPAPPPMGGTRRAIAPSPRLSATSPPLSPKAGIGVAANRSALPSVGAVSPPLAPGARPSLPDVAMNPLPVLALGPPAPSTAKPAPAFTGRISLPSPTATNAPAPNAPAATATGRVVIPPSRPVPPVAAKSTVTDLTVVPKSKRPPITQAVKRQSVLKVLRGESAAAIAASLGIREAKLDEWVDAFIAAGAGALTPAPRKARASKKAQETAPLSAELLRSKLAEVLATAQLIERAMEAQLQPRRPMLLPPPDKTDGHHTTGHPRKKG